MYFKATFRNYPELGLFCCYYRLVESYRNIEDTICHKTILNLGFVPELKPEQLNVIQKKLTQLASGTVYLFLEEVFVLDPYVVRFWDQILSNNSIDIAVKPGSTNSITWVDLANIKHEEVCEIGAEYIDYKRL
jgi:hypothetical protein